MVPFAGTLFVLSNETLVSAFTGLKTGKSKARPLKAQPGSVRPFSSARLRARTLRRNTTAQHYAGRSTKRTALSGVVRIGAGAEKPLVGYSALLRNNYDLFFNRNVGAN